MKLVYDSPRVKGKTPSRSDLRVTVHPLPPQAGQSLPASLEDAAEPLEARLPQAGLERIVSRKIDQSHQATAGVIEVEHVDAAEILLEPRDLPLGEAEHARQERHVGAPVCDRQRVHPAPTGEQIRKEALHPGAELPEGLATHERRIPGDRRAREEA